MVHDFLIKETMEKLERINRIQNEIDQLRIELEKETTSKRWEPIKNGWAINGNGCVVKDSYHPNPHNQFKTEDLGQRREQQQRAENELFSIWEHLLRSSHVITQANKYFGYFCREKLDYMTAPAKEFTPVVSYRIFPSRELAIEQYRIASDHAKAYLRGEI